MSNLRPVSILNTFSKVNERVPIDQIVHDMEKYFSSFFSAYRKNYRSHLNKSYKRVEEILRNWKVILQLERH